MRGKGPFHPDTSGERIFVLFRHEKMHPAQWHLTTADTIEEAEKHIFPDIAGYKAIIVKGSYLPPYDKPFTVAPFERDELD